MHTFDYSDLPIEELDSLNYSGPQPTRQGVIFMINRVRWIKSDRSKSEPKYTDPLMDFGRSPEGKSR